MNALLLEGGRRLAPAIVVAAKSVPAAEVAGLGLIRTAIGGLVSMTGAFVAGAAVSVLLIPRNRAWLAEKTTEGLRWAKDQWTSEMYLNLP